MATSLDNYVKSVITFSSAESNRELVELNRKSLNDVLEKNASSLTNILQALNVEEHSLSVATVLLAKINQACSVSSAEMVEESLVQIETALPFFKKPQLLLAPDIFIKLFRKVYQVCLQRTELLSQGITLLNSAIDVISGESGELTSLHACLFCLCLKAKLFDPALKYLSVPISKIMKEIPGDKNERGYMDSRSVLLYFYYGGLIYGAMGQLHECMLMMQNVLCVPAFLTSAIMVEAYKKYLLLSLILYDKVKPLPGYRATVVQKLQKYCFEYHFFENVCISDSSNKDPAQDILNHLQSHHNVFLEDNNVGLVKRLARKMREAAIIKLSKTFLTMSLGDLTRRCHLPDCNYAERYLTEMNLEGKICAKLDKVNGLVHFEEPQVVVEEEKLNAAIQTSMELATLLKSYDTRIRTNYVYVSRSTKVSCLSAHDDEGFQQGTSSLNVLSMMGFPSAGIPSFELNVSS
uniref:COP9 signalosome complex subunit 3 n=1 Tax=Syphacia muris TaxID=451379 RepID=A0A0N5ASI1_9BILA